MRYFIIALKGIAYGVTHVAPGLGGGLVLIVLGIYEPFVESVGNLFVRLANWRRYLAFLIPLGIGMVVGVIGSAKLIIELFEHYPVATNVFFMGLLLGTVPSVIQLHEDMRVRPRRLVLLLCGVLMAIGFHYLEIEFAQRHGQALTAEVLDRFPLVLYNGVVSLLGGAASVTPGMDGSLVLIIGGTYEGILSALSALSDLVIHWGTLISTGLGAGLGIVGFSKLIDLAIKRSPSASYYAVLGLVLGSVASLWPSQTPSASLPMLALVFAAGFAVAYFLGRSPEETEAEALVSESLE